MAIQKRKAVTSADSLFKAKSLKAKAKEEEVPVESEEAEQTEEASEPASEPLQLVDETELRNTRRKELKSKHVDDIKALVTSSGLSLGKKEDMIEAVIQHEAQARADALAQEAEIRAIVVAKKEELEKVSVPELTTLCKNIGITGALTKAVRVEKLLTQWQEEGGVDKARAKKSHDAREEELEALDTDTLHKLCEKAGADSLIKEVMVERALRKEAAAGHFCPPKVEQEDELQQPSNKGDVVAALIATEALRKKEKEQKRQQEEEDAEKRKELKSKSVDELKKLLLSKGLDATGKKDDMVEALFQAGVQEAALAARKANLKSMPIEDLKKLAFSKGLEVSKQKEMVEALLSHEAKQHKDFEEYQAKVADVLKIMHEELETKTATELKDLCAEKGLKLGLAKPDRIQTLLLDAKGNGEVDTRLSALHRQQRKDALLAMDKPTLKSLCDKLMADAFVKTVMIERLLEREMELGCPTEEPAKKKARRRPARRRPARRRHQLGARGSCTMVSMHRLADESACV